MFWRWVEFSGAALFTVLVKGAGFSSALNAARTEKCRIGIEPRGNEINGKKTRIHLALIFLTIRMSRPIAKPLWRGAGFEI
jgi:hypothetical protein